MRTERRQERSDVYTRALRLQLAASARRGGFETLALTGPSGRVLAHVGDGSRLAALGALPLHVARGARPWSGQLYTAGGVRRVRVTPIACALGSLFLCAVGGDEARAAAALGTTGLGVARIVDHLCPLRRQAA